MPLLGDDYLPKLLDAARQYIDNEHDHADEWLGTVRYDKRAWAGYLALALMVEQELLAEVPAEAWEKWSGAIVWFSAVPVNAGDRSRKAELVRQASELAADRLAWAFRTYVRGELARGHQPYEAELLSPSCAGAVSAAAVQLAGEIQAAVEALRLPAGDEESVEATSTDAPDLDAPVSLPATDAALQAAVRTWTDLVAQLIDAGVEDGTKLALKAAELTTERRETLSMAVAAWVLLLRVAPRTAWSLLRPHLTGGQLGQQIAFKLAQDVRRVFPAALDEAQLAEVYAWLSELFPAAGDRWIEGAHFVGPDEQAREMRDRTLRILSDRGTTEAVDELVRLQTVYPESTSILAHLVNARATVHANGWLPPEPAELVRLLDDEARRLARTNRELRELIESQIAAISADLPSHGDLLWDRSLPADLREAALQDEALQRKGWRPKPEAAFSAYLAHELRIRLTGRGLAISREVLVRPTNEYGAGDRTDVLVEANLLHEPFAGNPRLAEPRLAVVIEVKANWSPDLLDAQREQLAGRYLEEARTDTGLYVVGWFSVDLWTAEWDRRRSDARGRDSEETLRQLEEQAAAIEVESSRYVRPRLVEIPRSHPDLDGDPEAA